MVCMWVTQAEHEKMKNFIQTTFESNVQFDQVGMVLAMLPVQIWPKSSKQTFCSRYILECLQAAEIPSLQRYNSTVISPSKLRGILCKHERCVVGALPTRLQSMQDDEHGHLLQLL